MLHFSFTFLPCSLRDEDNLRLQARAEVVFQEKEVLVSQIALTWMLHHPLDLYSVISVDKADNMRTNIAPVDMRLTRADCAWLDLQQDQRS